MLKIIACSTTLALFVPAQERVLSALDVDRVRELHRITTVLGDDLWPGFDARDVPIAVNNDNCQELLIGHPSPPGVFTAFDDIEIEGEPVMIRDGSTFYGPKGGGWAKMLAGEHSAYVGPKSSGRTEDYLLLVLHECFHVYQKRYRPHGATRWRDLPEDDPEYSALLGLESRILHAALTERKCDADERFAKMFIAVRHLRREGLVAAQVRSENEHEFSEGTAKYIEARALQLLSQRGGLETEFADAGYEAFRSAKHTLESKYLNGIKPARGVTITSMHGRYQVGMAQCLLLDRVRPSWKSEMRAMAAHPFGLLEKQFPIGDREAARLVAIAMERFNYMTLIGEQTDLIEARIAKIRGLLEARGRRYRIHHSDIREPFRWKPHGPVYTVPESLLTGSKARCSIWVGGIERFEKPGLDFESKRVPVIVRQAYLEWIDPDPAADGGDLRVESKRLVDGVHHDCVVETDGFVLRARRVRIEMKGGIVHIRLR